MATYVMSDIHGQKKLFDRMLKQINFSPEDELYILGDVVDRGPDGIKMLLKTKRTPNIHLLMGNHEYMMMNAFKRKDDVYAYFIWMYNGARPTLAQFKNYTEKTRVSLLEYISKLPVEARVTVNGKEFILCHAQPHPTSFKNDPFENFLIGTRYITDEEFSVWQRYAGINPINGDRPIGIIPDENFKDKTVVFGHTPVCYYPDYKGVSNTIRHENNTINVDCGCAAIPYGESNGRLACLRLDNLKEFYEEP